MGLRITVWNGANSKVLLDSAYPMSRHAFTLNNARVPDIVDGVFAAYVAIFDRGNRRNALSFEAGRTTKEDKSKFSDEADAIAFAIDHAETVPASCNVELLVGGWRHTFARYLEAAFVSAVELPRAEGELVTLRYTIIGGAFLKTKPA